MLVGGDEPLAHLDSVDPVRRHLDRERRASEVVPGARGLTAGGRAPSPARIMSGIQRTTPSGSLVDAEVA